MDHFIDDLRNSIQHYILCKWGGGSLRYGKMKDDKIYKALMKAYRLAVSDYYGEKCTVTGKEFLYDFCSRMKIEVYDEPDCIKHIRREEGM